MLPFEWGDIDIVTTPPPTTKPHTTQAMPTVSLTYVAAIFIVTLPIQIGTWSNSHNIYSNSFKFLQFDTTPIFNLILATFPAIKFYHLKCSTVQELPVKEKSNLPYIIIGVVILVIIIVLLIGCILFKRHNRDKGVSVSIGTFGMFLTHFYLFSGRMFCRVTIG